MQDKTNLIYQAMANILNDIDAISKSHQADMGKGGNYKFRGIDDMYNALHNSFGKHQVFIIPEVITCDIETQEKEKAGWQGAPATKSLQYSCKVMLKVSFVASDGSMISAVGVGHALDTSDKATNKAQSSALKYVLMQTFLIPTEEVKDVESENLQIEITRQKAEAVIKAEEYKVKYNNLENALKDESRKFKAIEWYNSNKSFFKEVDIAKLNSIISESQLTVKSEPTPQAEPIKPTQVVGNQKYIQMVKAKYTEEVDFNSYVNMMKGMYEVESLEAMTAQQMSEQLNLLNAN